MHMPLASIRCGDVRKYSGPPVIKVMSRRTLAPQAKRPLQQDKPRGAWKKSMEPARCGRTAMHAIACRSLSLFFRVI